jgi:mRNA interferase MazF
VIWVDFGSGEGREQQGRRRAVVVSSNAALATIDTLAIVVPVTSRNRQWPNHVPLTGDTGLEIASFAMVEQVKAIARERVLGVAGSVDDACLRTIRVYLQDFLDLSVR